MLYASLNCFSYKKDKLQRVGINRPSERDKLKFVGRAKRAEFVSPEGERTQAGGGAAEPRNPCNAEKRYLSPGNLRRKKALQYSDSSLSVTPFHGAQNYFPSLAGAALTIVRLPLPEFFRPLTGASVFGEPAARNTPTNFRLSIKQSF